VWSRDFARIAPTTAGNLADSSLNEGFTHECPAIRAARRLEAVDVVDVLPDPFSLRRVPGHIRSDNGPEFVATSVRARIAAVGATTACIASG
jgi:hypothetical protein